MTINNEVAVKDVVVVATTADITLSGEQTIDGISVVAGDRVLVKDQTIGARNGIWVCASGGWIRADDFTGGDTVVTGTAVPVAGGTVGAGQTYYVITTGAIIVGATSLAFSLSVAPITEIGTEETSPDGTENFAIDDGGTPKYISIANAAKGMSHTDLNDIGTNTHAQIDAYLFRQRTVNTITADTTLGSTHRYIIADASTASANVTLFVGSSAEDIVIACVDATNGCSVIPSSNQVIGPASSTSWPLMRGETLHVFHDLAGNKWEVQ